MRKIELLAPGGDLDSIKAAIMAGANAVYCGLERFNARNRAGNISFDELQGVIRFAHQNDCKVLLTLNIVFVDSEIPALIKLLNRIVNTRLDGVILQDLGLFFLISKYFPTLKIHASTQMTTHNVGQVKFLSRLGAGRVNLSRELNIKEVKSLTDACHECNKLSEVFVHGSYCISFSGLCYMSSLMSGNSGNRGRCSQPCRDQYETTPAGKNYPLNLKDNSAFHNLRALADAGVDSLKIEGRIKSFDYVYTVVDTWKKHIGAHQDKSLPVVDESALYKVFNRDFSNSFLSGEIGKDMFIDNPRDHSIAKGQEGLYEEQIRMKSNIRRKIDKLNVGKAPMTIIITGKVGEKLKVECKSPDEVHTVFSELSLSDKGNDILNPDVILSKLKSLNETEYYIDTFDMEVLENDLYLPYKELNNIRRKLFFLINGSRQYLPPVVLPKLKQATGVEEKTTFLALISDIKDMPRARGKAEIVFYRIPAGVKAELHALKSVFQNYPDLIPWFPSVLIGDDYSAAIDLLRVINTNLIVTNNTGLAFEAGESGISWIAGPHMNITNSYSLRCLKGQPGCRGAFLSNELSREQIRPIKKPEGFDLYFSIFHPIELMTTRQCLTLQVEGCEKSKVDDKCLSDCQRNSSIRNMNGDRFIIDKRRGEYHSVYNDLNYYNPDIENDFPEKFTGFLYDLRNVNASTGTTFQQYLKGI